jgi:hypothetical protein
MIAKNGKNKINKKVKANNLIGAFILDKHFNYWIGLALYREKRFRLNKTGNNIVNNVLWDVKS